ncbi:hypothetical protein [Pseudomonas lini]|uniref:Uncharacterized protein n=1 Tax=Pseudomonas lini TaxID=163011 RepID=A0A0J6H3P9_9PSED|nr:hypothetical protein [Pseudomonas lini]KAB0499240.1 hypothetical protein F7R14_25890 [Pseudomonas lini]KMM88874.1 hypothetical protein TU81_26165 [Pseudomonas lini]SDS21654.1 hypothetical protein SAMN04490191_0960 [Pseudomonas lini]
MNRQGAAQLRISPLLVQQGLFVLLALLITLIGGQQYLRWEQSQQPETPHLSIPPQTHFSAASSSLADSDSMRMMDVDQAQPVDETPQERWVF